MLPPPSAKPRRHWLQPGPVPRQGAVAWLQVTAAGTLRAQCLTSPSPCTAKSSRRRPSPRCRYTCQTPRKQHGASEWLAVLPACMLVCRECCHVWSSCADPQRYKLLSQCLSRRSGRLAPAHVRPPCAALLPLDAGPGKLRRRHSSSGACSRRPRQESGKQQLRQPQQLQGLRSTRGGLRSARQNM